MGQPKITRYQHRGARNQTILSARLLRTSCFEQYSQTWFQNMHDSETFWNLFDSPSSLGSWLPHKASVRLIRLPFWEAGYLIWYSVAAYGNCLFSPSALSKRLNSNSQSHLPPLARTSLGRQKHQGACIHKSEEAEEYIVYRCITLHGGTGWSGRLRRAPAIPPLFTGAYSTVL